jgi:uncharacterized membrane protein
MSGWRIAIVVGVGSAAVVVTVSGEWVIAVAGAIAAALGALAVKSGS